MMVYQYINNDDLYEKVDDRKWRNIRTGKEGEVEPDKAKSIFTKHSTATQLLNEYPLLCEAIKVWGLKMAE